MRIQVLVSFAVGAALLSLTGCCYYAPMVTVRQGPGGSGQTPGAVTKPGQSPAGEPLVRVRLGSGSTAFLSSSRGLTLTAGSFHQSVGPNQVVQAKFEGGLTIAAGGKSSSRIADTLAVTSAADGLVRVGDRSYRGRLLLYRSADGDLAVVNVLGLEDYLCGVVPCEIGSIDARTVEAAKAQAVAARSFTVTRLGKRQGLGHDLFDSYLRDQEYQGIERETELCRQAVRATRGEMLEFHGGVCEALYHGNCGGVTANGSQPYLKSVPDTPGHRRGRKAYCSERPSFSWQVSIRKESLEAVATRLSGKKCRVRGCKFDVDRQSHRVKYLDLATDRGSVRLPGSDFRMAMGLKSTGFTMAIRGATVSFTGHGSGHGSGMCQDGAVAMALGGASYQEILHHYYSGVGLNKRY
ncbi:MAG: SpoIID/LytB domain-containing protein [candidate division WOR-3 bacterium]|nr:SpoIID/LytB domain-containing protein [candidate division WOR-3 bacterium]